MFDTIQGFYKEGMYTADDVKVFVVAGWITEAEYEQITGTKYAA